MHPAYFETRFRAHDPDVSWPDHFVILSAYATTGEVWPEEKNVARDQELLSHLQSLNVWHTRIIGYSPSTDHAEPSWAVSVDVKTGKQIGAMFQQDAIYIVSRDRLLVTQCRLDSIEEFVSSFMSRLDTN